MPHEHRDLEKRKRKKAAKKKSQRREKRKRQKKREKPHTSEIPLKVEKRRMSGLGQGIFTSQDSLSLSFRSITEEKQSIGEEERKHERWKN